MSARMRRQLGMEQSRHASLAEESFETARRESKHGLRSINAARCDHALRYLAVTSEHVGSGVAHLEAAGVDRVATVNRDEQSARELALRLERQFQANCLVRRR